MTEIKETSDILESVLKRKAIRSYNLIYDSSSETLEPVYFWILDFMNQIFGGDVKKIVDNYSSSPGSGHFSELMAKATRMQEEGMKIMQTVGILIKSLINIVYDLKQFEMRLDDYKRVNSKNKEETEVAKMALKQIWMDNVDIKRGNTSIKAMAFSQASFATLIDAFMIVNSSDDVKKMDLNDRVKRILEQRIVEFGKWLELSEKELKKRYNIERAWLKNQVDSLKLYSRWAKPYLKTAEELGMAETGNAALVKAFNTITMQLTIMGKSKIDPREASISKEIPSDFKNMKFKRQYYSIVLVDFKFRGIPQKAGQHYIFGGRAEVTFKAYGVNEEELSLFEKKLSDNDLTDALKLVESTSQDTLDEIKEDLEYFLKDEKLREAEKKIKSIEEQANKDVNPFMALFGIDKLLAKKKSDKLKKESDTKDEKEKKAEELEKEGIKKDNYAEGVLREYSGEKAKDSCYTIYDVYKKAHGMASTPGLV